MKIVVKNPQGPLSSFVRLIENGEKPPIDGLGWRGGKAPRERAGAWLDELKDLLARLNNTQIKQLTGQKPGLFHEKLYPCKKYRKKYRIKY